MLTKPPRPDALDILLEQAQRVLSKTATTSQLFWDETLCISPIFPLNVREQSHDRAIATFSFRFRNHLRYLPGRRHVSTDPEPTKLPSTYKVLGIPDSASRNYRLGALMQIPSGIDRFRPLGQS